MKTNIEVDGRPRQIELRDYVAERYQRLCGSGACLRARCSGSRRLCVQLVHDDVVLEQVFVGRGAAYVTVQDAAESLIWCGVKEQELEYADDDGGSEQNVGDS